ncbi:MAG: hypothetical protein C0624_08125 [Desulfuromonas sp.]|nr:MAG: hypothetical protein C0624_08125 [Desulfuromonas sp.]
MTTLDIQTEQRSQMLDVTSTVSRVVRDSGVHEGLLHLFVPHTTAAITINENADPDVIRDMLYGLEKLVPNDPAFRHAEGNSDAHIKSSLIGCQLSLPFSGGAPLLGTWQGIYFCEFDGPRQRQLQVKIIAG